VGRLLLEPGSPCAPDAEPDENGQPQTREDGRGTGSRSAAAFAAKYGGELLCRIEDSVSRVRLLVWPRPDTG